MKRYLNTVFPQLIFVVSIIMSGNAKSMTFQLQEICINELSPRCQNMVLAEGPITKDTPKEFKEWSQSVPPNTWIALTSPGGSVVGGMQLGLLIRSGGFNTTIGNSEFSPANCLSACAYAFVGGVSRLIPSAGRYGLHQYRPTEKEISAQESQKLNAMMAKYLDSMGVDRRVLDYAQLTSSDKMVILSSTEAKKLKVDNFGESAYPKWRLEALPDGKVALLNSATIQGKMPASIGLLKNNQKIVCAIYYKSNDEVSFAAAVPHKLIINNQTFLLNPISKWQEKTGGYQINLDLPKNAIEALSKMPEDGSFTVVPEFYQPPRGIHLPVEMRLGVAGLKNAIAILMKS